MIYVQLITPTPNIPCTPNLCLKYVRETYKIPAKYLSAIRNWNASKTQHKDKNFPNNWVPVWFTVVGNSAGHVALRQPDGSIWSSSSSFATQPVHHPSLTAMYNYWDNRLAYLGWTEDIENVKVIKEVNVIGNENHVKILFRQFVNREPTEKELKGYAGKDLAYALGKLHPARINLGSVIKERDALKKLATPAVTKTEVIGYISQHLS